MYRPVRLALAATAVAGALASGGLSLVSSPTATALAPDTSASHTKNPVAKRPVVVAGFGTPGRRLQRFVSTPRSASEWLTWGVQARVVVTDPEVLPSAASLVRGYLTAADAATNRDRADSEIRTYVSAASNVDGVAVTPPMFAHFLEDALAVARLTDGKLTPTAGSADPHSWWKIRVENNRVYSPDDVVLDLSATARASSADHCAASTATLLGCGVLVGLGGGDIAVAGPAPEDGWQIQVQDLPGDPTCQVALPSDCGIATASTVKPLHRESTATPMWRTVSVIASSCAQAAAFSRVAVGMGGSAIDWLHQLDVPARLVDQEYRVTVLGGWPDE